MKISFNWLKDFINIPLDPVATGDILTDIGLEIEKIQTVESIPGGLKGLVIGEVKSKEKHPDADRLNISTVDVGAAELSQIVCGAANLEVGQRVVVAVPGTVLFPTGGESFKIKSSKIRGVESHGMICAEDEIGMGKGHDGIMILSSDATVGMSAAEYFEVENEIVLEIGLTPNRADAMGHMGVARDLMVAFKHKGILPKESEICLHRIDQFKVDNQDLTITVEVKDKERCPKYAGVTLSGVEVKDSPEWLRKRLVAIGLTPKNNIVDATNYVLHELGQPLHAFDADIVGDKVIVDTMSDKSKFTTLDDVERELHSEDLMICNQKGGMCIAGVFGGAESGVSEKTTNIFLESAYFNPVSVRKTAKRHGLNTDASFRFERGVDPELTVHALKRCATLIQEIAGGKVSSEIQFVDNETFAPFDFEVSVSRIEALIGHNIGKETMVSILTDLDITIEEVNKDVLQLKVPTYRVDVTREADIAEEILRIYGFNNIPLPEKLNTSISNRDAIDKDKLQNLISDFLADNGVTEGMSNSLTKASYSEELSNKRIQKAFDVEMLNPLSRDLSVLRQGLIFGGLEAIRLNQNYGNPDVKLFEFGKSYQKFESGYQETNWLAIFLSGRQESESWNTTNEMNNFYTIKGLVEGVLKKLGIFKNVKTSATKDELLADGLSYTIAKKQVANIGWTTKQVRKHFDIKQDVFFAEINWDIVLELIKMNKVKFSPITKFPAVTRDLSLLLDRAVTFGEIEDFAGQSERKLLKEVSLFDVYEGKNLPDGKKSYAVRFVLQDETKTLKDKDIEGAMSRIQKSLEDKLSAQLR
ncbi:MAG: phenylalanyl-tRNA synthetase beta chain [Parvicella sp.]|jgi:phenylalanyl-tRNA synthetase beta chain